MKVLALLLALTVPPTVEIPPDLDLRLEWNRMYYLDQQICSASPIQAELFPMLNRCVGLI